VRNFYFNVATGRRRCRTEQALRAKSWSFSAMRGKFKNSLNLFDRA
jgi:hypothetical protein